MLAEEPLSGHPLITKVVWLILVARLVPTSSSTFRIYSPKSYLYKVEKDCLPPKQDRSAVEGRGGLCSPASTSRQALEVEFMIEENMFWFLSCDFLWNPAHSKGFGILQGQQRHKRTNNQERMGTGALLIDYLLNIYWTMGSNHSIA